MFSELPGSVVWYLALIWRKFSVIIASVPFSLLLLGFQLSYVTPLLFTVLCYFVLVFFCCCLFCSLPPQSFPPIFLFFFFALGSFCRHILNHRVSFPQLCLLICPTKAFFISVSVLIRDISLFDFSLEFPSVCLSYTSVLVCCLLFPVEPSACWS